MPGVVISKSLLVPPIVISPAYDKSDAVALAILYVVLSVGIVTLVAPINTMVGDVLSIIMLVLVSLYLQTAPRTILLMPQHLIYHMLVILQ